MTERDQEQKVLEQRARRLNGTAIKSEKMLPEGESLREDYSIELGTPLSATENRCYLMISESEVPVSVDELFKGLYGVEMESENDKYNVYTTIVRIRQKLGEAEIITVKNEGYLSRRALIGSLVNENKGN